MAIGGAARRGAALPPPQRCAQSAGWDESFLICSDSPGPEGNAKPGHLRIPARPERGQGRAGRVDSAGGVGIRWRRGGASAAPPLLPIGAGGGGRAAPPSPATKRGAGRRRWGGVTGVMQSCGRWWGRLAARGAPRHLRPAAGGPRRQQQRWGGGEAARCIEQLRPRHDDFCRRHIGPREREKREMLSAVGVQVGACGTGRRAAAAVRGG